MDLETSNDEVLLTKKGTIRKRKPKKTNVYFTQENEDAILAYLASDDSVFRNRIFDEKINYSFHKLAENIIHTFKFYYIDVDTINELKHEVVAFLLEKLHLYDPSKGKAFSYFGTIAKRYLIVYNEKNYKKVKEKGELVEVDEDKIIVNDLIKESNEDFNQISDSIDYFIKYVDKNLTHMFPRHQDQQIADVIIELFRKRENIEIFNKKAIYIYIREMIDVDTFQITKVIKILRNTYYKIYNEYYENGYVKI